MRLLSQRGDQLQAFGQDRRQGHRLNGHAHVPAVDARDVQNIVNQIQQMVPAAQDSLHVLVRVIGQSAHLEHLGKAKHGVERGTQLVTHAREKLALGAVSQLGFLFGSQHLGVSYTLHAQSDCIRYIRQGNHCLIGQWRAREERDDAPHLAGDTQRTAGERHETLPDYPVLVGNTGIAVKLVGHEGAVFQGNQADRECADGNLRRGVLDVLIQTGLRPQIEH